MAKADDVFSLAEPTFATLTMSEILAHLSLSPPLDVRGSQSRNKKAAVILKTVELFILRTGLCLKIKQLKHAWQAERFLDVS